MTGRRVAGYALLSLVPVTFIVLAALSGQWADFAIGLGVAGVISAATFVGMNLLVNAGRKDGKR